jgi:hypothetical protein
MEQAMVMLMGRGYGSATPKKGGYSPADNADRRPAQAPPKPADSGRAAQPPVSRREGEPRR